MAPEKKRYPKPDDFQPVNTWPEGHRYHGNTNRCLAWNRNEGRQCRLPTGEGKSTCRFHGGRSLKGAAHPNAKSLRYSKYVPENLRGRYEEMQNDPELLSLAEEIRLVNVRITQLLSRLNTHDSAETMFRMEEAFEDFRTAQAKGEVDDAREALERLGRLIQRGTRDYSLWADLMDAMETKKRLADSERRRLVEGQMLLELDRVMNLIVATAQAFRTSVNKYVEDEKLRRSILSEQADLLDRLMRRANEK